MTCVDLRRQIEAEHEAQICARGELELRVPSRVYGLLGLAIRTAQKAEGRWISNSKCLRRIAEHCIGVWKAMLKQRSTVQRRVLNETEGSARCPAAAGRRRTRTTSCIVPRAGRTMPPTSSACASRTTCTESTTGTSA